MKTRHVVFLVLALVFTAAALISALLSNSFISLLDQSQEAVDGTAGGALASAFTALIGGYLGVIFMIVSFVLIIPAVIFTIIDIRVPVLWLRIVSAILLALNVTSLIISVGTILLLTA